MRTKRWIPAAAAVLCAWASAGAESGPAYRGFESDGMGRTGTASIEGVSALFLNPAGLADLKGNSFQMSADMGLNGVLLDYAAWVAKNYQYVNSIDSLLVRMEPVQNKWAPFSNSVLLQGNYQDFAISLVEDIRYEVSLGKAVITPVPGVGMLSDLQVAAGRGFRPIPDWRVGFTMKYLYRLRFRDRYVGTTDEPFYVVRERWNAPGSSISQKIGKIGVAKDVSEAGQGFGLNLGAIRQLPNGFSAGVSLLDFPTFFNGGFLYPQLNLGGAYFKDFNLLEGLRHRVIANLDWQIPFSWQPWFKQWKAGVGVEGRMGDRLVSLISMGFNDGYPTFGLKVGYYLNFYYLYTAEETGSYPGQFKLSYHKIGITLEF